MFTVQESTVAGNMGGGVRVVANLYQSVVWCWKGGTGHHTAPNGETNVPNIDSITNKAVHYVEDRTIADVDDRSARPLS